MVEQVICCTRTQGALTGCTVGSGLSWDTSETTYTLLIIRSGKTNPLSLFSRCMKKMPCGWGCLLSTGLLRGFGPHLLGSHLHNQVRGLCSIIQPSAKLQAWALLWKQWLRNRSKRWHPHRLEGGSCRDEEVIQRWGCLLPNGGIWAKFLTSPRLPVWNQRPITWSTYILGPCAQHGCNSIFPASQKCWEDEMGRCSRIAAVTARKVGS